MSVFKSEKYIPKRLNSLTPVAEDLMLHFRHQGFEVIGDETLTGGWDISIHKGGLFKAVLGMKTALKVSIEPSGNGTVVKAGIGIFGQQVIPTLIMLWVFWPILLAQLWGMVRQSKLDNEAIEIIEKSMSADRSAETNEEQLPEKLVPSGAKRFCTQCGTENLTQMKFCPECGQRLHDH
jgi:hypothetical protein